MARYAGGGKNTVESCRSIDVLGWHRRGYLRSPRWFSWTWTREGERVRSINVETQRHSVLLKYRSRSYGEDWSDVEQLHLAEDEGHRGLPCASPRNQSLTAARRPFRISVVLTPLLRSTRGFTAAAP